MFRLLLLYSSSLTGFSPGYEDVDAFGFLVTVPSVIIAKLRLLFLIAVLLLLVPLTLLLLLDSVVCFLALLDLVRPRIA